MSAAPRPAAARAVLLQPFADALLAPGQPCPAGLRSWNGSDPSVRFAVYRNNVITSLVDALADTFPVVRELVGAEFHAAMARLYVVRHPPVSAVLAEYGAGFPAFIEQFPPAAPVPYLADVARLEWLRVRAFHAADAEPLDTSAIQARLADPQALAAARVILHPAVAALRSRYAIVSLWGAHQGALELSQVDPMQPQSALVTRRGGDVLVHGIDAGCAEFVAQLAQGVPLSRAAAAAADRDPAFDLARSLAVLIGEGAFTGWRAPRSADAPPQTSPSIEELAS